VSIDLLQVVGFRVLYAKRRPCALCQTSTVCFMPNVDNPAHCCIPEHV